MKRLIDANDLMEHACRDRLDSRELILAMIENAPTVDAVQVVHGHWEQEENMRYSCSNCHALKEQYHDSFCGNCGAKMDRKDGEQDDS